MLTVGQRITYHGPSRFLNTCFKQGFSREAIITRLRSDQIEIKFCDEVLYLMVKKYHSTNRDYWITSTIHCRKAKPISRQLHFMFK
jgi:hypothetical protein